MQSTSAATPAPQAERAAKIPVAAADQPLADKLRETLGAKTSKYFDRKNERTAVETFYAARSYAPLWTEGGALTARAKGVIARLRDAGRDGLDAGDYPVSDFTAATTPDMQADAELKLTAAMLDYARHAQSGRMHWSRVSADILYPEHPTNPAEVLANVTAASDASAALKILQSAAQALPRPARQAGGIARRDRNASRADRGRPGAALRPGEEEAGRDHARTRACLFCAPASASRTLPTRATMRRSQPPSANSRPVST